MSDEFDGLDATEKAAIGAALNRCRALAAKIANELRNKRPEYFVDKLSMADIQASLERAADGLSTVKGSQAGGRQRGDEVAKTCDIPQGGADGIKGLCACQLAASPLAGRRRRRRGSQHRMRRYRAKYTTCHPLQTLR